MGRQKYNRTKHKSCGWEGLKRAFHSMAEIQFAAGASAVMPLHSDAGYKTGRAKPVT